MTLFCLMIIIFGDKNKKMKLTGFCIALGLLVMGCSNTTVKTNEASTTKGYQKLSPDFDADSAYQYVDQQVAFGPRVPNTKEHVACGDYLVGTLKSFGAKVQEQKMVVTAFDGTKLNARNIIGVYGEDKSKRVLLFAHWDSRPFADADPDKSRRNEPILGANDGASGVGVLLEVARQLSKQEPEIGVDIIFFDAEDYGDPVFAKNVPSGEWWCLGSQYWAKNPHVKDYKANYGILLDMVGAKDATFFREYYSKHYGENVLEKVWSTARQLGYSKYFIGKDGGGVTDDHLYVNRGRNIPSIDIIHLDESRDFTFGEFWHTHKDDMSVIDKETLKAVGQTVLEVIYKEKGN